jgi:hypothetical protein
MGRDACQPCHVLYDRLQKLLADTGFDAFVEETCKPYYAPKMGAPSPPPGLIRFGQSISSGPLADEKRRRFEKSPKAPKKYKPTP